MSFDPQPTLSGVGILVRPLAEADRAGLTRAASDPRTWAGHPASDRWKPEVFASYFEYLLTHRSVVVEAEGVIIGASRFYAAPDAPHDISIGFTFLDCAYWGGAMNRALKTLMLDHAFASFDRVWFHIAPGNIRSQKATAKLGAVHDHDAVLNLSGQDATWQCWMLPRP